ncbi:MAG TPA: hypothetical protein VFQ38_17730 [Longimicrobiales bacterium]|nr:hypothetical protein [Longimicrobiales bacterium]
MSALLLAVALPLAGCPVPACAARLGAPGPVGSVTSAAAAPLAPVPPGATPAAASLRPAQLPPSLRLEGSPRLRGAEPLAAVPRRAAAPYPGPRRWARAADLGPPGTVRARPPGEDKLKHFFMSFAITSVGYGVARLALDHGPAVVAASAGGALAGIGKEAYDARTGGDASVGDLAWDALGIGVGTALNTQIR